MRAQLERLQATLEQGGLRVYPREPLARHTIIRVGGPADLYVPVYGREELVRALQAARAHDVPVTVLGGGSNVLVADAGIAGLVLSLRLRGWTEAVDDDTLQLTVEAGLALAGLALRTARQGWAGLHWAEGIPGTVGGATVYNAGAFGGAWADRLRAVEAIGPDGHVERFVAEGLGYSYRMSRFQDDLHGWTVLSAELELEREDPKRLLAQLAECRAQRRRTQPSEPSAGSIFRNPPGFAAGWLIEQAGLKGVRRGDAVISPRHANFIVNLGQARAADVRALMELAQERVEARFGIRLEPEVRLLGQWDEAEAEERERAWLANV